jgi:hypothetical protein
MIVVISPGVASFVTADARRLKRPKSLKETVMHSRTLIQSSLLVAIAAILSFNASIEAGVRTIRSSPTDRLTVHEWGTFTCLQDEAGRGITGLNTDDEAVPKFVHRLADHLVSRPTELAPIFFKGIPRCHPSVVMRLETPVMYFYPPRDAELPMKVDVRVDFRGGWISEFYPDAEFVAPGFDGGRWQFGPIGKQTVGSLTWRNLSITDAQSAGPQTDARVWLAPRKVEAAPVVTPKGESEHYLFYRGVGNLQAPLRIVRHPKKGIVRPPKVGGDVLAFHAQVDPALELDQPLTLPGVWLVHVREDGAVAYRTLDPITLTPRAAGTLATTPADFDDAAYATANLPRLRDEMRQALIADGLYEDEAEAMLATWELAYFKSEGLRVFFLLPQAWTDAVLPVTVSRPTDLKRTMVGRIELVTPRDRELLSRIAKGPASSSDWLHKQMQHDERLRNAYGNLSEGKATLRDLKIDMPADYRAYVGLGRFRNALVLDELTRRPTQALRDFVGNYNLGYFEPTGE